MLRRKKRRIAHGTEAGDVGVDNNAEKPCEAGYSVFTKMQRKWGKIIDIPGGFYTGRKREAPRRVLSRRLPGIKLRARMLLKRLKDRCGKFFPTKIFCKRKKVDGSYTENVHYTTTFRSPSHRHPYGYNYQHDPHFHYPIFPSLAHADAIAECIEFIKQSSSSSSSSSSSTATSTSSCLLV